MENKNINLPDNYDTEAVLKETKDKLDRPDKFADIFCQAAKSQVKIKDCLGKIIREMITKDAQVNQHLNNAFKEIIAKDTKIFYSNLWRKLKGPVALIGTAIGSVVLTLFTQYLMKKLGL